MPKEVFPFETKQTFVNISWHADEKNSKAF